MKCTTLGYLRCRKWMLRVRPAGDVKGPTPFYIKELVAFLSAGKKTFTNSIKNLHKL